MILHLEPFSKPLRGAFQDSALLSDPDGGIESGLSISETSRIQRVQALSTYSFATISLCVNLFQLIPGVYHRVSMHIQMPQRECWGTIRQPNSHTPAKAPRRRTPPSEPRSLHAFLAWRPKPITPQAVIPPSSGCVAVDLSAHMVHSLQLQDSC